MPHEPSDAEIDQMLEVNPGGMTLDAIAATLGVTKARVQQILARAIGKVQKELRWRRIKSVHDLIG